MDSTRAASAPGGLLVVETHAVQYHAPVYRELQQQFGIPVTAVYGSDFSVAGYHDPEFATTFAWDTDLLGGYTSVFLSRVTDARAPALSAVSARGLGAVLRRAAPAGVLLVGYSPRFHRQAFWQAWRAGHYPLFRGETTDHARRRRRIVDLGRDRFLRWLYGRCSGLLYVGRQSLEHYRRLGCPGDKLFFSPYCVDASPFQPDEQDRTRLRDATRHALGATAGDRVLLFSGKLVSRKAPELLLEAVASLPVPLPIVLFLGDGCLRQALRERAAQLDVRARFVGFANQHSLSAWYHAADLLVLPSRTGETWGVVVNEALRHGLPCVVSTRVGCAPDLVEPGCTGEVFEAGSGSSLRAALQRAEGLIGRSDVRAWCRAKEGGYSVGKAAEGIARAFWTVGRDSPVVAGASR